MIVCLPIHKIRVGGFASISLFLRSVFPNLHQALRILVRQTTQESRVYYGKDGCVCTDAYGKRDDDNRGKRRSFDEHAEGVSQVLNDLVHRMFS